MKQVDYDKLLKKFDRLNSRKKVPILMDAIELMQSFNGRSVDDCIVFAMGGDYPED